MGGARFKSVGSIDPTGITITKFLYMFKFKKIKIIIIIITYVN